MPNVLRVPMRSRIFPHVTLQSTRPRSSGTLDNQEAETNSPHSSLTKGINI